MLLDGNNATVVAATLKYNWAMTTAIDAAKCLMHAQALTGNDDLERRNDGGWVAACSNRHCQAPESPGMCPTYNRLSCNRNSICSQCGMSTYRCERELRGCRRHLCRISARAVDSRHKTSERLQCRSLPAL